MPNMSYCRFGNTFSDLQDCANALDEGLLADLSGSELAAALKLIALCVKIADEFGGEICPPPDLAKWSN